MDCGEQCIDYFCFGPRDNRERFRPWKKKSRAVIEAEEQAKKEKKKNARRHRKSKAPKAQNAVRPLHHHCDVPQANRINVVSPTSHDAAHAMREPPGDDQLDGVVPQCVVLQLKDQKEQIEQLRLQLDDAVGAKRKADAERDLLEKEVKELRSTVHDSHKSLHRTSTDHLLCPVVIIAADTSLRNYACHF
ncbi:hypothetical protein BDN67DRAFT_282636 [Paxillus ammoniavirescens]|nr:hypothetical protein BDN67DRAFT_282636 [Paxillus ammoniavirescens]